MSTAGHIRPRGKGSWELKFEAGPRDPATGKRKIQYVSFRGTKREAQVKLGELVAAVGNGSYIEPSKITVAEHVRARVDQWEAAYDPAAKTGISPKTAERYRELVENQIVPHIGAKPVQKLKAARHRGVAHHAANQRPEGRQGRRLDPDDQARAPHPVAGARRRGEERSGRARTSPRSKARRRSTRPRCRWCPRSGSAS